VGMESNRVGVHLMGHGVLCVCNRLT